jgi:hypothetical protein
LFAFRDRAAGHEQAALLKSPRHRADETRMAELDARTVRMGVLAAALLLVILLGALAPHEAKFVLACAIDIGLLVVCWLKGKPGMVLAGCFVPLVGLIGAIRLAKPASYWAWHWYESDKMAEAQRRFAGPEGALADPS